MIRLRYLGIGGALALFVAQAAFVAVPALPAQAQDGRLHVIASFSILADVAANVAGDAAEVEALIPRGANPHAYEPSAQDVVRLGDADLVLAVGLNFEEGLLSVLREATGADAYDEVWGCLPLRRVEVGAHEHGGAEVTPEPAAAADCAPYYEAVAAIFDRDDLAAPGAVLPGDPAYDAVLENADPHVWTDPVNVALWTLRIRDLLSALDPAHAEDYAAHAGAYLAELAALDRDIQERVASIPPERRVLATNHLTLGYFAARYGLDVVGVSSPGGSTAAEPSVREVLGLVETIRAAGVPALFTETTASEDLAQQVADEAGVPIVRLYTGSLSEPGGPADTYLRYMRFNVTQIVEALR